jgi:hypothetical protein
MLIYKTAAIKSAFDAVNYGAIVLYVFSAFYLSIMNAISAIRGSAYEVAKGNLLTRISQIFVHISKGKIVPVLSQDGDYFMLTSS